MAFAAGGHVGYKYEKKIVCLVARRMETFRTEFIPKAAFSKELLLLGITLRLVLSLPAMAPNRYGASGVNPEPLAQPLQFHSSGKVAKNRFLKSPMAEMMATWTWNSDEMSERGIPTKELIELYRQ